LAFDVNQGIFLSFETAEYLELLKQSSFHGFSVNNKGKYTLETLSFILPKVNPAKPRILKQ